MSNDYGGLKADRLRVKINFDGRPAGRFTKYRGSIGFKNKAGQWTNRYVDLMVGEGAPMFAKGDSVIVSGRMTIEDREYQGNPVTDRVIWVDSIQGQGQQPTSNPSSNPPSRPGSNPGSGRDQAGFATDTQGMDDVPFAFMLVPLAGLVAAMLNAGVVA